MEDGGKKSKEQGARSEVMGDEVKAVCRVPLLNPDCEKKFIAGCVDTQTIFSLLWSCHPVFRYHIIIVVDF
jgi:hypothetical protein